MNIKRFEQTVSIRLCGSVLLCLLVIGVVYPGNDEAWTRLYHKVIQDQELTNRKEFTWEKEDVMPFTQLVFSWNAWRPKKGYFAFWVQVRNQKTQRWGVWHKMMEWGADVQSSYVSEGDDVAKYVHVRLEVAQASLADAFRITVVPHNNAHITNVKSMAACLADFNHFKEEDIKLAGAHLPSVYIPNVPMFSQFMLDHPKKDSLCSPTSCSMMVGFVTGQPLDPVVFAESVFDNGLKVYGSWPFNVAQAFHACAGACFFATARLESFRMLHRMLCDGVPVVVSVRGPIATAPRAYLQGHLLVVVGWDAPTKTVIVHDPAFAHDEQTQHRYALKDFLTAWERSRRLAYVAISRKNESGKAEESDAR